jgi:hypothetical protein
MTYGTDSRIIETENKKARRLRLIVRGFAPITVAYPTEVAKVMKAGLEYWNGGIMVSGIMKSS